MEDVIMCNHRDERDVGLMLMSLSKIPRDTLDRFEENYDREMSRSTNNWLTGFQSSDNTTVITPERGG